MPFRAGIVLILGVAFTSFAIGQTADEYQVKAAYLYNLAKFVEWPPASFRNAADPIVVCILGTSPITEALGSVVKGKTIENRAFIIRPLTEADQSSNCQMLFVSSTEGTRLHSILLEAKARGVLTVGEADTFIAEGGVVNFKLDQGRIRIQINVDAATQSHLQISSKLLSLVEIVRN